MRVAITGGTGFVGRHLARTLVGGGHEVVLIARGHDRRDDSIRHQPGVTFVAADLTDEDQMARALAGCDGVAHFAGINRELAGQAYQRVHVAGTRAVVAAARRAGTGKVLLLSFLRARPDCGSPYHESKWQAEEIVRAAGLDYTILKSGMIYGRGDHMLDHLSHALHTFPIFALVGLRDQPVRPVAVEDVVALSLAALVEGRLARQTVAVTGPEELTLAEAVRRVAAVVGRHPWFFRLPVAAHYLLAWCFEQTMHVPLVALAQVRILAEGVVEPLPACPPPPDDLLPRTRFTEAQIRRGLPPPGPFGWRDCRWLSRPIG
jgi:NADH dehydrogenase